MEENSKVEFVTMNWCCYLLQIVVSLLAIIALKIIYFFIKRRYTKTLVVNQNPTEESETHASRENVLNGSSSESLNVELEKKCELLCQSDKNEEPSEVLCINDSESSKFIHTEDDLDLDYLLRDLINFDTTSEIVIGQPNPEKFMDKDDTVYNGYGSTEDEMPEFKHSKKFHDVLNTCIPNSDSRSTIISWKSCNKDIDYSESDYVNNLSSENQKIHQPLNLCIKDNKNETETNIKNTKTFFTDRKYKNTRDTRDILMINSEHSSVPIEDEQNILKVWNKLKKQYDILMNTKIHSSILYDKLKNLDCIYDKELRSLGLNVPEKLIYHLENIEHEQKHENRLEITKLSIINHNEFENKDNLENVKHELESEGCSDNTELSITNHNESENENNMDKIKSSLNEDELVLENNLETTELSDINQNEWENEDNLDNTELSITNHNESENENNMDKTKSSLNEDELMLENNLETTEMSSIIQGESIYEYNLESPQMSSLNNDKSISGIDSPIINCIHDYEVQGITDLNSTSSTEVTESLPSPIHQTINSIDDIRYVEDYNDISFFDPTLSDDAMNEAFIED
ncbi:uncharacterized protein LOC114125101 [Aphis gossypii]|uniref:uncharacterized protein LOC114125101 n=1 Tax=Aphis gossypii TaxID=80765 RepID=UPI002158A3C7|nr:uncharacterized protein LOC114125101 [Aphis gossypii]